MMLIYIRECCIETHDTMIFDNTFHPSKRYQFLRKVLPCLSCLPSAIIFQYFTLAEDFQMSSLLLLLHPVNKKEINIFPLLPSTTTQCWLCYLRSLPSLSSQRFKLPFYLFPVFSKSANFTSTNVNNFPIL